MDIDGEDAEDLFADPEESTENNNAGNEKSAENSVGVRVSPPKRTRTVKTPRLKFDPERLCGKRGIPVLVNHFKNTKFSGKGHEKEDLDKLMAVLEHWTHRLFPSMKFEECLQQIERLGKKRPVQTCLMKIRMDMPILSSDFLKEKEEDHVMRNEDLDRNLEQVDPFDELIMERQDAWEPPSQVSSFVSKQSDLVNAVSSNCGQVLGSKMPSIITEEQKQIMERNRLLAIERRKAKLAAEATSKSNSQDALERPASVSFDSLLSSSPGNACSMLEETVILCTSFKDAGNPEVGAQNSPVLGINDFKDCNEEMDVSSSCAPMDSTIKIAVNPLNNSSNNVDEVIDNVQKCQNTELVDSVDLRQECTPGVSGRRLEDADLVKSEIIDLDAKKANFVEGPKDSELSPQIIPSEYLGLESLMDLVDED